MGATGKNVRFTMAWQEAWGQVAAGDATAWSLNAAPGQLGPVATEAFEHRALMGFKGDAVDPIRGAHDVSGSFQVPLCARQTGMWLRGLLGDPTSSSVVGARGGFLIKATPLAEDTITIGGTTLTFGDDKSDIEIAEVTGTVANAVKAISALDDLTARAIGPIVLVEHDTADETGDAFVTQASAGFRVEALGASLRGGGNTKHVFADNARTGRPFMTFERDHTDLSDSNRFAVTDSVMVRSIALEKQRGGEAMASVDLFARYQDRSDTRILAASVTELTPAPFSYLGGSVIVGDLSAGVIDSASFTIAQELTSDGFDACSNVAGVVAEPLVGDSSTSVDITARVPQSALLDAAYAGTPVSADLVYLNRATGAVLHINVPRIFVDRPSLSASGREAVTASFSGAGYPDPTSGARYSVELYTPTSVLS